MFEIPYQRKDKTKQYPFFSEVECFGSLVQPISAQQQIISRQVCLHFVEQRRRVDREENYRDLSEGEIIYTELGWNIEIMTHFNILLFDSTEREGLQGVSNCYVRVHSG